MMQCHNIGLAILQGLSPSFGPVRASQILHYRRTGVPSTSSLSLLRYVIHDTQSGQFGHVPHTNVGILTFLFATEKRLQVLTNEATEWRFVKPRHNSLLVNVGDSLHLLSGGIFKSTMHPVVSHEQVLEYRQSLAYYMRPTEDAPLQLPDGRVYTSLEWHERHFQVFCSSEGNQSRREDARILRGKIL